MQSITTAKIIVYIIYKHLIIMYIRIYIIIALSVHYLHTIILLINYITFLTIAHRGVVHDEAADCSKNCNIYVKVLREVRIGEHPS